MKDETMSFRSSNDNDGSGTQQLPQNLNSNSTTTNSNTTKIHVHCALVFGQVCFGVGSVVTALGLPAVPPLVFALYREIAAGLILLVGSGILETEALSDLIDLERSKAKLKSKSNATLVKALVPRRDVVRFLWLGAMVYGNQACFLAGIKLAGPVAGAIWQPSQPLWTATISMATGQEPFNARRMVAVLVAFAGCVFMVVSSSSISVAGGGGGGWFRFRSRSRVLLQDEGSYSDHSNDSVSTWIGNGLFLINCLCTSVYVLSSRAPSFQRYPPLWITATTYTIAAGFMIPTAVLVSASKDLSAFFCPECEYEHGSSSSSSYWSIPPSAMGALAYNVVFTSVIAYGILMWANKKSSTGTMVMAYTVLQPVTAAVLTVALVRILRVVPECSRNTSTSMPAAACLDPPGWGSVVGTLAVLIGLCLVVETEPSSDSNRNKDKTGERKHEMETIGNNRNNSTNDLDPLLPTNRYEHRAQSEAL